MCPLRLWFAVRARRFSGLVLLLCGLSVGRRPSTAHAQALFARHRSLQVHFHEQATGRGAPVACQAPCRRRVFVFFVLNKFPNEKDVLQHVRLGGFVQTSTKPLSTESCNGLQRKYRMVKNLYLDCGLPGHNANSGECPVTRRSASSSVSPVLPLSSTSTPSPALAISTPRRADPVAPAPSTDDDFEAWFAKRRRLPLSVDAGGWLSFKNVLIALGESPQNPARLVTRSSDSPAKLWKLGERGKVPKENTDWKRASASTISPWLVRKDFLKRVVQERYPSVLRKRG